MTGAADAVDVPVGEPSSVALHVRVWNPGAARRVLVVHGVGSDGGTMWRIAEEVAAAGATAVAPDLRNHGLSPTTRDLRLVAHAADVAELADAWDLVVGHSLGGAVLAVLCARPGFARRALLLDPVLRLADDDRGPLRDRLRVEAGGNLTPHQLALESPQWSLEDRHRKVLAGMYVSTRTTDLTCDQNDPWDVTAAARDWTCPVTVLGADPAVGTLLPVALREELATVAASSVWRTVEGTGHSVHRDDPEAVCAVVRELLTE